MLRNRDKTPLGSRYVATREMGAGEPEAEQQDQVAEGEHEHACGGDASMLQSYLPGHPLADQEANEALYGYERGFRERFARLVPVLKEVHALQHEPDFELRAQDLVQRTLGYQLPESMLADAWIRDLDTRALYLHGMFEMFDQVVNEHWQGRDDLIADAERAIAYFLDCDFHEVDITPCSDGRLLGLRRFILRLPALAVRVRSYAGALFDIEEGVQHWTRRELIRHREGVPTSADVPSRYLKIAAYHYSSSKPNQEGCAAHGSNERDAAEAALLQLRSFRQAIENTYSCGASVDTLLIGVDTDTDAIKVHVPDADTRMSLYRYVDCGELYRETLEMDAQSASLRVYEAIQEAINTQGWGKGNGPPHEGMLRLVSRLLLNNISQLDYVARYHGGRYADVGHQERMIIVGDHFSEMQVRNFAYFTHLDTMEEGAKNMDVAVNQIFRPLNISRGLPIPVVVHYRYNRNVPGSRERVEAHCRRVKAAIMERFRDLAEKSLIGCHMVIRDKKSGSRLELLED
ncbi:carboxysome shell carbonic anhydrase [Thioalkalivibrio sulfidiphilus HL-EbGr7]|uniref:Carboxysome shell carbonic anhydrase n=2 Tax=Thioalkalivibrio TaxID=106633 RepID=B8GQP5_THISH|nr:carboxysome shell carbonic anhydrase [Thioalkalivibrio sulfidiphilus]ACL74269.1 carboxysome shell carbonic anhydrase [Thioalkalivibrio sulfidiphilus HL-EbGr7]